jgi:entry exclusion lipoprotein TrbK
MKLISILVVAMILSGCAKSSNNSDQTLADRQAADCEVRVLEHYNIVPETERDDFSNICLQAAGFKPVGCRKEGVIMENGGCWIRP